MRGSAGAMWKHELEPADRILSAMLQLHRRQCATFRRFVTLVTLAGVGLVACFVHRTIEGVVDLPVDATAVLAVGALALGILEMRTLKKTYAAMQELRRQHRIARLRGR